MAEAGLPIRFVPDEYFPRDEQTVTEGDAQSLAIALQDEDLLPSARALDCLKFCAGAPFTYSRRVELGLLEEEGANVAPSW